MFLAAAWLSAWQQVSYASQSREACRPAPPWQLLLAALTPTCICCLLLVLLVLVMLL